MKSSTDYEPVKAYAQNLANELGREVGIEKLREFGHTVYTCKMLPERKNRYGWELTCEVVPPMVRTAA